MLGCDENFTCLRARCILDDTFTEPFLFFAASKELTDQDGMQTVGRFPHLGVYVPTIVEP